MKKRRQYPVQLAANKQGIRKGKQPPLTDTRGTDKLEIDYFHLYESLYRKEVTDWQNARLTRYDPFNPVTYPIQQLYKDAMLDNHLRGAVESRILRIINKEFVFKDKSGQRDDERSAWVQKRWFRQLIRKAIESKFFGYSMVFIQDYSPGNISGFININRENVVPEKYLLLKDAYQPMGESIDYRMFSNNLIYIQLNEDAIGILERIAPMTIFKRHSWASWDEFEQIFGVPIRIARTAINTDKHKNELQSWLETMGTAAYAIFDKQVDIEIKENQKTDSFRVFAEKISIINKEISKGILGQTMTMDDGSSKSQADVHLEIYQDYTDADIMDVQDWISDDFIPVMRNLGYDIPEGHYVELVEKTVVKPENRIKIDQALMAGGWNMTPKYIEDTYDVELDPDNPRSEAKPAVEPLGFFG
jgi:hypothetical protein